MMHHIINAPAYIHASIDPSLFQSTHTYIMSWLYTDYITLWNRLYDMGLSHVCSIRFCYSGVIFVAWLVQLSLAVSQIWRRCAADPMVHMQVRMQTQHVQLCAGAWFFWDLSSMIVLIYLVYLAFVIIAQSTKMGSLQATPFPSMSKWKQQFPGDCHGS